MEKIDIAIIGAGVVGLAIARELSGKTGKTVAVLERNLKFGQETSSRNSEVIHSGIYYPHHLLKTQLCLEGRELLYQFCEEFSIEHRRIGKLVISHDDRDAEQLFKISRQALANDVEARYLSKREIIDLEPAIAAENALLVPSSGTINSHHFLQSLYYQARRNQVVFLFDSPVLDITYDGRGYLITSSREKIWSEVLINAAGLEAADLAASIGIDVDQCRYTIYPCKGEYFRINRKMPVSHLIYPIPGDVSLGIHLTIDTGGAMRLGPSAFYVRELDYSVNEDHRYDFFNAAARFLPGLRPDDLSPDFSGIRPKLQGPDDDLRDFVIQEESSLSFPGLINLIGIESPGLTSSLAIARYVGAML